MRRKLNIKNREFKIYLLITIVLVMSSLIFMTSILTDVMNKINTNKKVMNLNYYIERSNPNDMNNQDKINKQIDCYYKSDTIKDHDTGKDYNVVFISKNMLHLKQFKVKEGKSFDSNINESQILVGSKLGMNINDEFSINLGIDSIKGKVIGILDGDEALWEQNFTVPSNLSNSVIVLDRDLQGHYFPAKKFMSNENFNLDEHKNFTKIKNYILENLFKKQGPIYISIIFAIVLLLISINSINIIMSLLLEKRKKEFAIKYSLGSTNKYIIQEISFEFFIISICGLILSTIISIIIQKSIPQQSGYTLSIKSIICAITLFLIITIKVVLKINKKIRSYSLRELVNGRT